MFPAATLNLIAAVQQLNSKCTVAQVADLLHANDEKDRIRKELSGRLARSGYLVSLTHSLLPSQSSCVTLEVNNYYLTIGPKLRVSRAFI